MDSAGTRSIPISSTPTSAATSRPSAQRIGGRDLDARMRGIVYHAAWANRFRDEPPQAYRDLHEVMRAQRDLVRTERSLAPILNDKRP